MGNWQRNVTFFAALGLWAAYIVVTLYRKEPISELTWGVPGAIYVALNIASPKKKDDE